MKHYYLLNAFLLYLLLTLLSLPTFGQTTLKGKVVDGKKVSIPGANIFLKGTYDGTTSDENGDFEFSTTEEGAQVLEISFIGYESYTDTIQLNGGTIDLEAVLKEEFNELKAVMISAGAFEASDEGKAVVFKPLDIVTTAGAAGDIYGALGTLPGATQVGNEEGLFVRGGAGYETATMIDGMLVQNPYFSSVPDVPNRGRFSPFLFKGTVFSSGGYSAQYGQALSSAIVLNSQDLGTQTVSGLNISPIFAGGFHQHAWKNTSLSVSADYTNLYLYNELVPQNINWTKPVEAFGSSLIFRQKTSQTGVLKLYSTFSTSTLGIAYPDGFGGETGFNIDNNNLYVNGSYKEILGDNWTVFAGFSHSDNKDDILLQGFNNNRYDSRTQAKLMFTDQLTEKVRLRFGGELHRLNFNSIFDDPLSAEPVQVFDVGDTYGAAFFESDIFITNDLAGRIGVRSEYSSALDKYNVAPRLSLAYKTGENSQVSFAYGQFFQTPQSRWLGQASPDLDFEKASHYILNYQVIANDRTFRVEGFYKDYPTLTTNFYDPLAMDTLFDSRGEGQAAGIELFLRDQKSIKNADYWISYSYLNTKRRYLFFEEEVQPSFASEHVFSAVYKHYISAINTQIGATYTFQSGRPYDYPCDDELLGRTTPNFQNVALNASYLTNIKGNFTVIFISASNVLGFDQVFGYRYFNNPSSTMQPNCEIEIPIGPPARRTYFAGMFISLSYNKVPKTSKPTKEDQPEIKE